MVSLTAYVRSLTASCNLRPVSTASAETVVELVLVVGVELVSLQEGRQVHHRSSDTEEVMFGNKITYSVCSNRATSAHKHHTYLDEYGGGQAGESSRRSVFFSFNLKTPQRRSRLRLARREAPQVLSLLALLVQKYKY